jgi:hypothetical protein
MRDGKDMKTIHKEYRVDKTKIGFIKFIFEGHEGVAIATTLDPKTGHIRLAIAPDRLESARMIVEDLKKDFIFDEV